MNELTFSCFISLLLKHLQCGTSKYWLVCALFKAYLERTGGDFEYSQVSRWCSGTRPIPTAIIRYYQQKSAAQKLAVDISHSVLPCVPDPSALRTSLLAAIASDSQISDDLKEHFSALDSLNLLVAELLTYAMRRPTHTGNSRF